MTSKQLEWLGSALGLLGAFVLALNASFSGWGFVAFLASNCALLAFAARQELNGIFCMQLGFTGTSLLGIYRWGDEHG